MIDTLACVSAVSGGVSSTRNPIPHCLVSQGVRILSAMDSIPQYGRCGLSRAVVARPRKVARDMEDGGLGHDTVERETLVRRLWTTKV